MPVKCADGRRDGQRPHILTEGRYKAVSHFETTNRATLRPHNITGPQRELMGPVSFRQRNTIHKYASGVVAPNEPFVTEFKANF
eukprot:3199038-Pyramimonas_sp.AAC.1